MAHTLKTWKRSGIHYNGVPHEVTQYRTGGETSLRLALTIRDHDKHIRATIIEGDGRYDDGSFRKVLEIDGATGEQVADLIVRLADGEFDEEPAARRERMAQVRRVRRERTAARAAR